jgi:enamine deaminase RidA (YjgF/YER057c/UK114 family)
MTDTTSPAAEPTRINPGSWAAGFRYDQAQLRPAPTQLLTMAGQGAIDHDGTLRHPGDVAAQLPVAIANVEELLATADMTLRDVLRLVVYVTDVDAALGAYGALVERLDACGATPPATLVGVERLALPGMTVEIEATAGR